MMMQSNTEYGVPEIIVMKGENRELEENEEKQEFEEKKQTM